MARGLQASNAAAPVASGKLMLFGGPGHRTYLGCLSCSRYEAESISNRYGTYGSRYSAESIFNRYGEFGSRYSDYSACNPYASDPPVLVDGGGNFYGRLTINQSHPDRVNRPELRAWIAGVCAG